MDRAHAMHVRLFLLYLRSIVEFEEEKKEKRSGRREERRGVSERGQESGSDTRGGDLE
jgi:hypothetical protein